VVLSDLRGRLANRVQLTTDGHSMYLSTVPGVFNGEIDYAMLIKEYGNTPADGPSTRYSPAPCTGIKVKKITGAPDPAHIARSYVERQNLTIRMNMRRFTRLTNAFSKKLESLTAAVSLHFMYYNFARPQGPRQTGRLSAVAGGRVVGHFESSRPAIGQRPDMICGPCCHRGSGRPPGSLGQSLVGASQASL
jgi:hypothetical protein